MIRFCVSRDNDLVLAIFANSKPEAKPSNHMEVPCVQYKKKQFECSIHRFCGPLVKICTMDGVGICSGKTELV